MPPESIVGEPLPCEPVTCLAKVLSSVDQSSIRVQTEWLAQDLSESV